MNQLTIVGLGPGSPDFLTLRAIETLKTAKTVYLRTEKHPIVDYLHDIGVSFNSFDELYQNSDSFDDVYRAISDGVIAALQEGPVVYAVPGNPFVAERTVTQLIANWPKKKTTIIHGTSFLDAIVSELAIDPVDGLHVVNALDLNRASFDMSGTLVCIQCYSKIVASELKIWLSNLYTDDCPVTIARAVGIPKLASIETMPLYRLDRYDEFDHLTSVVVKANPAMRRASTSRLIEIMATLRSEEGCPWDRQQNHQSLKPYVLEEAYEVAEAISAGDIYGIEEELGDLLLQVVFHAQIAAENGDFNMVDVLDGICKKMVQRHPHVFDGLKVEDADEVKDNWEAIKRKASDHQSTADVIKKYTPALPALFRAQQVITKCAKAGFDWQNPAQAFAKLTEEVSELKGAILQGDTAAIEEELGDLLLAAVCLAYKLDIVAESALQSAINKYSGRFARMESQLEASGVNMKSADLDQLIAAWQAAKRQ